MRAKLIHKEINKTQRKSLIIDLQKRTEPVEKNDTVHDVRVEVREEFCPQILMSLMRAGETELILTKANRVVLFEPLGSQQTKSNALAARIGCHRKRR